MEGLETRLSLSSNNTPTSQILFAGPKEMNQSFLEKWPFLELNGTI